MIINTVTDLRRECDRQGCHWFGKDEMRYFSTRVRDKIYKGKY
ncbi:unnamed protein product, partial [marine sediment metagenome]